MRRRSVIEVPASRIHEVRHGRNFIRCGDFVRVLPSESGRRDGFRARFLYADSDKGGLYYALQELATMKGKPEHVAFRFMRPERVVRQRRNHGE